MWSRRVWCPAVAGASAFWLVNLAISLTPVAADYRAALSISYIPMLVEAAIAGTLLALLVSWTLVRFPDHLPGRQPVTKAALVSLVILLAVTVLIEVPGKLLASTDQPVHYLLIATVINALRIPALGLSIGAVRLRAANRGLGRTR